MKRKNVLLLMFFAIASSIVISVFATEPGGDIGCTSGWGDTDPNWGYCTLEYFECCPTILESATCTVTDGYKNCNGIKMPWETKIPE
ncbi:MAG: hypothetical protein D4R64_08330 [Porphyromonadaceae bacterium]|nr:MAG: hypothetical protein D4R64_08330 [Porphyromonadaceae bacterium]